jgi:hypothetical protein
MKPRRLTQREQQLIQLYSCCQLEMTPERFLSKWEVNYEIIACICSRSVSTVRRWFIRGKYFRSPTSADLRHLALMDFLLDYYEEIPEKFRDLLCLPNRNQ